MMRRFNEANRVSSTLSSSSSSNSNSSSSSCPLSPFSPAAKTMEEVWKDINLSSLQNHHSSSLRTINLLQDFLARPFAKDPPPPPRTSAESPPRLINLNSAAAVPPDLHFLQPPMRMGSGVDNGSGFEGLVGSGVNADVLSRNRFGNSDGNSGDRRCKRMIKNRESAARSRARKQAYTTQLEQEVSHLAEENTRLKKQIQQLCVAAAAVRLPLRKKPSLYRTSTAPF